MIPTNEIDDKFDPNKWENISKLKESETNSELIEKVNELSDYVNYLFRFLIGKPE